MQEARNSSFQLPRTVRVQYQKHLAPILQNTGNVEDNFQIFCIQYVKMDYYVPVKNISAQHIVVLISWYWCRHQIFSVLSPIVNVMSCSAALIRIRILKFQKQAPWDPSWILTRNVFDANYASKTFIYRRIFLLKSFHYFRVQPKPVRKESEIISDCWDAGLRRLITTFSSDWTPAS